MEEILTQHIGMRTCLFRAAACVRQFGRDFDRDQSNSVIKLLKFDECANMHHINLELCLQLS